MERSLHRRITLRIQEAQGVPGQVTLPDNCLSMMYTSLFPVRLLAGRRWLIDWLIDWYETQVFHFTVSRVQNTDKTREMDKQTLQYQLSAILNDAVTLDQQKQYGPAKEKYTTAIGLLDQLIRCACFITRCGPVLRCLSVRFTVFSNSEVSQLHSVFTGFCYRLRLNASLSVSWLLEVLDFPNLDTDETDYGAINALNQKKMEYKSRVEALRGAVGTFQRKTPTSPR